MILLETVVIGCILIILDGKGVLTIFLVDLSNAFLGLCDVADSVGVDVKLDGGFEEFDAFCGVNLFFHVGSLLVEIGSLSPLAKFVALDALDIGPGCIVPTLCKFVVGCCLFEEFDGLLSTLGFVGHDVSEKGT